MPQNSAPQPIHMEFQPQLRLDLMHLGGLLPHTYHLTMDPKVASFFQHRGSNEEIREVLGKFLAGDTSDWVTPKLAMFRGDARGQRLYVLTGQLAPNGHIVNTRFGAAVAAMKSIQQAADVPPPPADHVGTSIPAANVFSLRTTIGGEPAELVIARQGDDVSISALYPPQTWGEVPPPPQAGGAGVSGTRGAQSTHGGPHINITINSNRAQYGGQGIFPSARRAPGPIYPTVYDSFWGYAYPVAGYGYWGYDPYLEAFAAADYWEDLREARWGDADDVPVFAGGPDGLGIGDWDDSAWERREDWEEAQAADPDNWNGGWQQDFGGGGNDDSWGTQDQSGQQQQDFGGGGNDDSWGTQDQSGQQQQDLGGGGSDSWGTQGTSGQQQQQDFGGGGNDSWGTQDQSGQQQDFGGGGNDSWGTPDTSGSDFGGLGF